MMRETLVSVGLPTRNRAASLRRAIASVLDQDWPSLELVVCDNASTDETEEICRGLARDDERLRYVRRNQNIGAEANFADALRLARGEIFMWLADDDWQGPSYVSSCAQLMLDRPDHALVAGRVRYFRGESFAFTERPLNLQAQSALRRVVAYYGLVTLNGVFYGAMRRDQASALPPPTGLGGDWLFVASLAGVGKVRTLEEVFLNRSLEGVSKDARTLAASHGLAERAASDWHVTVARRARADILTSAVFAPLGERSRTVAGVAVAGLVVARFSPKVWVGRVLARLGAFERGRALLEQRRRRRG